MNHYPGGIAFNLNIHSSSTLGNEAIAKVKQFLSNNNRPRIIVKRGKGVERGRGWVVRCMCLCVLDTHTSP